MENFSITKAIGLVIKLYTVLTLITIGVIYFVEEV